MRGDLCQAVKEIYQATDAEEARRQLKRTVEKYKGKASRFCDWLEEQ